MDRRPNFDTEVITPLKQKQAERAAAEEAAHLAAIRATQAAEAEKQAQEALAAQQAAQTAPMAYSGSLADWLLALRTCEAGGDYTKNTGNGYYGAYQFELSTWATLDTGYDNPIDAPPAVQDQAIITNTNRSAGLSSQNPGCYAKTGISNKPPAQ